jgi:hypothetical protein
MMRGRQFDSDGGGSIDVDELRMAMRSLGQKMTKEEAQAYLDGIQVRREDFFTERMEIGEAHVTPGSDSWEAGRKPGLEVRLVKPECEPGEAPERLAGVSITRLFLRQSTGKETRMLSRKINRAGGCVVCGMA